MPNTGFKSYATLEQYNVSTGVATGTTKPNTIGDPDYVAPIFDSVACPLSVEPIIVVNKIQLKIINESSQFISFGSIVVVPWNAEIPSQTIYSDEYNAYPGEIKTILNPTVQQIGDWYNFIYANNTNSKLWKLIASVYFTNSTGRTLKIQTQIDVGGGASQTLVSTPRTNVGGENLIEIIFTDVPGADPDPNIPPIANAGPDQSLNLQETANFIQLAGSGTDIDGTIVGYQWTRVSGPLAYTISNPLISNPTLTDLVAGIYVFKLTVTDNIGAVGSDNITITVTNATDPNGIVIGFVDSSLSSSTISQIILTQGGVTTNLLSSPITSINGPQVISFPKGLYDLEVITTGTGGSVRIQQGSSAECQLYSGAGSYVFFGVQVNDGSAGLAISLTASPCGITPVYAKLVLGSTSHLEQATAPWGKEIIDSQVMIAMFYSDSGGTTPINVSLALNYRIVNNNLLTSTSSNVDTYTVLTGQNSVVIGGNTHVQKWDYTKNDPLVQEPADKIVDITSTYSLLPGAGYIVIP